MRHWFACLDHEQVVERWPRIRELLAPVVPKCGGDMEVEDFLHLSEDGLLKFAVMGLDDTIVLAIALSVITYPRKKVLDLHAMGGTHSRLFAQHYLPVLVDYARECGCDALQASWGTAEARLFRHMGSKLGLEWNPLHTIYRMGV